MKRPPPRDDAAAATATAGGSGGRGGGGGGGFNKGKGRWGGKRRNEQRLGGSGGALSLAAFANAKSRNSGYNPALIKKQKEFYKSAKLISKYKRSRKQQNQSNPPLFPIPEEGGADAKDMPKPHDKRKKRTTQSLKGEYEKKRVEDEKAKKERDVIIKAKKEEREKSEAKRKELREKMFKRTRSGQPVMKYRIEHLLETALESSSKFL